MSGDSSGTEDRAGREMDGVKTHSGNNDDGKAEEESQSFAEMKSPERKKRKGQENACDMENAASVSADRRRKQPKKYVESVSSQDMSVDDAAPPVCSAAERIDVSPFHGANATCPPGVQWADVVKKIDGSGILVPPEARGTASDGGDKEPDPVVKDPNLENIQMELGSSSSEESTKSDTSSSVTVISSTEEYGGKWGEYEVDVSINPEEGKEGSKAGVLSDGSDVTVISDPGKDQPDSQERGIHPRKASWEVPVPNSTSRRVPRRICGNRKRSLKGSAKSKRVRDIRKWNARKRAELEEIRNRPIKEIFAPD